MLPMLKVMGKALTVVVVTQPAFEVMVQLITSLLTSVVVLYVAPVTPLIIVPFFAHT